jgi:polyribonucleotide nucleotidyltransferase
MFDIKRKSVDWGGRKLTFETGRIARQADGAVLVTYGETAVLATVVSEHAPKPGLDFFPLTVNYQEKTFAAGKIPGGYFKREGRPTEKETLVSRLIDRRSARCSSRATRTRPRSSSPSCSMTSRTIPTSSPWSPPPPP